MLEKQYEDHNEKEEQFVGEIILQRSEHAAYRDAFGYCVLQSYSVTDTLSKYKKLF